MVKKMKKYVKFMVCMALIMGLIAPSYAALSASDGSAFVTKAEFDSALADFNARLTTFEAGINSKIDSQVTSYLDRNGIWNGKEQIVTAANGNYDYANSVFTYWTENRSSFVMGANTHSAVNTVLVNEVTKSGLCVMTFDVVSSAVEQRCCNCLVYFPLESTTGRFAIGSKFTSPGTNRVCNLNIWTTGKTTTDFSAGGRIASVLLGSSNAQAFTTDMRNSSSAGWDHDFLYSIVELRNANSTDKLWTEFGIPLTYTLGPRTSLYFVQKGQKLWFELEDVVSLTSSAMVSSITNPEVTTVAELALGSLGIHNVEMSVY